MTGDDDLDPFEIFLEDVKADISRLDERIKRDGEVLTDAKGKQYAHPLLAERRNLYAVLMRAMRDFS